MWLSLIAATSGYLTAYLIIYVLKKVWTAKRTPETKDQDGSRSKGSSSSQLRMYVEHGSNDVNTHKALEDSIPEFESTSRWVFREDDTIVTCDLDLIKTMVVDKTSQAHASHHVFKSSLDSDVRSQNSIMANGNRWGEIRQIVAPILS